MIGEKNRDSFLHVDLKELRWIFQEETGLYDSCVYEKAAENLKEMEKNGILIQDQTPCFYIYELTRKGKSQTGIAGCCSIDDYLNNTIKKHELTREDKELDRICHVDACDANTGPIFLACRYPKSLLDMIAGWKENHDPVYDFVGSQIGHRVWVIDKEAECLKIQEEFQEIPSLYIADGHHRAASAVKVGLKRRKENPGYTGEEELIISSLLCFRRRSLPFLHTTVL